jgi:hypothetical protein
VGALATKTAGILSSSSPHEVFRGALLSEKIRNLSVSKV